MGLFTVTIEKERALQERMTRLGIRESDLIEQFVKGSGKGGQKLNKTNSTVYLKHVPSGIEVRCQQGRSQSLNRFLARRELCEKFEKKLLGIESAKEQAREKIRRQKRKRSKRAKEKMLENKARRAELKRHRTSADYD